MSAQARAHRDLVAKAIRGLLNHSVQLEWLFGPRQPAPPDDDWLVAGGRRVRLCFVRNRQARRYILRLRPDGAARVTVPRGGSLAGRSEEHTSEIQSLR